MGNLDKERKMGNGPVWSLKRQTFAKTRDIP